MLLHMAITDAFPCSAVPFLGLRVALGVVVLPVYLLLVLCAVLLALVGQQSASRVATGTP